MPAFLRHALRLSLLGRLALLGFVLSLGVAGASPLVRPQALELVCASAGTLKVVLHTGDGVQEMGASHLDCPLCVPGGAPPRVAPAAETPARFVADRAPWPDAAPRAMAAAAAPLPARGPPAFA